MTTYEPPAESMLEVLDELLDTHHERLREAGVRVYLLAAFGPTNKLGDLKGPAIKHNGLAVLGLTRPVSIKHRVAGLGDAEILLDADRWEGLEQPERLALVDHELTHIEIVLEGDDPLLDSAGRPKLAMRPHDQHFGWFDEVALRHGDASQEVQQARALVNEAGQFYFAGMGLDDQAPRRRRGRWTANPRPGTGPRGDRWTGDSKH